MSPHDPTPGGGSRPHDAASEGTDRAERLMTAGQTARPAAPPFPFTLGQYRVVEKIGEGGMGAVYRALHGRLKKAVALKILPHGRDSDIHSVARFEREMEAIGRLNHDNIVRATDAGEADGVPYLVMELIDGMDLARLVRVAGPLPVAAACELVRQAAVGLQYVHENGLVHRDVKPSNLLLAVDGRLKITDLGLALLSRSERASGELTVTGQVMGTADYMAPEQWEDSHAVDIRADLYSLGCTLYTLLAGRPPFSGPKHRSALRKMAAHAKELVTPITDHRADVPAAVEELRGRLMAKDPADRPAEPAEVARALEPYCGGADLTALARAAMARPRPADAPAPFDHTTETRGAIVVAATPAAGRTITASDLARYRRGRGRRTAGLVVGAALLAAAVACVICLHPWYGAPRPTGTNISPTPVSGGANPPAADRRDRGRWRNLLAEPPAPRVWTWGFGARLDYDADGEAISAENAHRSLIRLGDTDARAYKLQVGLRQVRWTGLVGLYFGGREDPVTKDFHFQLIELCPVAPNNVQEFRLTRLVGDDRPNLPADLRVSTRGLVGCPLPLALDNSEQELLVEVKAGVLTAVHWNGLSCPDLATDLADGAGGAAGEYGIYCESSAVNVSTARFVRTD